MGVFEGGGAKWGNDWCDVDPQELVFTIGGSYVCANFGENRSLNATARAGLPLSFLIWAYVRQESIFWAYGTPGVSIFGAFVRQNFRFSI